MNKYVKSINNGDSLVRTTLKEYRVSKSHPSRDYYAYGEDDYNVPCENIHSYQETAEKYIDLKNNDTDKAEVFWMNGDYKNKAKVLISSRYNSKTKSVYISIIYMYK